MADDLKIKIEGDASGFEKELEGVTKQTKRLDAGLKSVAKISGVVFAGLTASIVGVTAKFAEFDNSMRGVKTLLDKTSFGAKGLEKGFADMQSEVLKIGKTIPVDLGKVSKAMFDAVSAGVEAGKATEFVAEAAKLAVAGLTDVSVATDGMTSAMNAYGLGAESANEIASKFFAAQKAGKTTVAELASGFGLVGSVAAQTGVSMDELLASVSAVTTAGVRTNAAYTGLKAILSNILKPTKEASDEAKILGVEFSATALRSQGLQGFLESLTKSQGFTKDSAAKLFGSTEALGIVMALTGKQAGKFSETVDILSDKQRAAATLQDAYATQSASLSSQFEILKGKVTVFAIQLGTVLAPIIIRATELVSGFFDMFDKNPELIKTAAYIIGITAAVAGAIAAFTTIGLAVSAFTTALAAIGLSVGWVVAGIGVLVAAIVGLAVDWEGTTSLIADLFKIMVEKVVSLAGALGTVLAGVFTLDTDKISKGVGEVADVFKSKSDEVEKSAAKEVEAVRTSTEASVAIHEEGANRRLAIQQQTEEESFKNAEAFRAQRAEQLEAAKEEDAERLLAEREEKRAAKAEQDEIDALLEEERNLADYELRAANFQALLDQSATFQEQFNGLDDLQRQKLKLELLKSIETDKTIKQKAAKDELDAKIKSQNNELKSADLHSKAMQAIESVRSSAIYQGQKKAFGELGQLAESENKTLQTIGKAAAIANIGIKTAESAIAIFSGFSTIPIIGYALGIVGAAAAVAFGATQIAKVNAANQGGVIQAFQGGGSVPGGGPNKDSVPAFLTPGELVAPRQNFDEVVNAVASQRNQERGGAVDASETPSANITIGFDGVEASNVLTVKQIEDRAIGVSKEG